MFHAFAHENFNLTMIKTVPYGQTAGCILQMEAFG